MTVETVNLLVSEIAGIEDEKRKLIRKIVAASLKGERDKDALSEMDALSRKKLRLTRPSRSLAA